MKKILFIAIVLLSAALRAQSLDQSNEPAIGDNKLMYLCDTLTDAYANTTGNGVVWDYSNILGANSTRTVEFIDPASTSNGTLYPTSTKAFNVQGSLINYFNSTTTERLSQGFVYEEPSFGTVIALFDVDEQKLINYPFSLGDNFSDVFAGNLSFSFNGLAQNPAFTGYSHASIDGLGTIQLPNGTSYSNVLRYKIVDTLYTQVSFLVPLDIEFIRTQYEYYNLAAGNLPVFTHSNVIIQQAGAITPLRSQTVVLSSIQPTENAGIESLNNLEVQVSPNPSNGLLEINGDFQQDATLKLFDYTGKQSLGTFTIQNGSKIDLSALPKGSYFVTISDERSSKTLPIVLY